MQLCKRLLSTTLCSKSFEETIKGDVSPQVCLLLYMLATYLPSAVQQVASPLGSFPLSVGERAWVQD